MGSNKQRDTIQKLPLMATQRGLVENSWKMRGTDQYVVRIKNHPRMLDGLVDVPVKEQFMMPIPIDLAPGPS